MHRSTQPAATASQPAVVSDIAIFVLKRDVKLQLTPRQPAVCFHRMKQKWNRSSELLYVTPRGGRGVNAQGPERVRGPGRNRPLIFKGFCVEWGLRRSPEELTLTGPALALDGRVCYSIWYSTTQLHTRTHTHTHTHTNTITVLTRTHQ